MRRATLLAVAVVVAMPSFIGLGPLAGRAQSPAVSSATRAPGNARPMTIPVIIRVKGKPEAEFNLIDLAVTEDGDAQTVLSIRAFGASPLTLAVLIQDDLVSSTSNEIKPMAEFIRSLPKGSRVLIGYLRSGSLQVRQKFTTDLDKAAKALRPPVGFASAAPFNPYIEVIEAIKRFEAQPTGRRAILLVSDGLDVSRGVDSSSATQSLDLQRAINEAQRKSIAVYAFYAPTVGTNNSILVTAAQGALNRLADETGGRAYFQGTGAPVSFDPFIRELGASLEKQIALTYLSTHPDKGFHRIHVKSSSPGVEVDHPAGYIR